MKTTTLLLSLLVAFAFLSCIEARDRLTRGTLRGNTEGGGASLTRTRALTAVAAFDGTRPRPNWEWDYSSSVSISSSADGGTHPQEVMTCEGSRRSLGRIETHTKKESFQHLLCSLLYYSLWENPSGCNHDQRKSLHRVSSSTCMVVNKLHRLRSLLELQRQFLVYSLLLIVVLLASLDLYSTL